MGVARTRLTSLSRQLGLTFTVNEGELAGSRTVALIPDGENVAVTRENRIRYIFSVANYRLNVQIRWVAAVFIYRACVVSRRVVGT